MTRIAKLILLAFILLGTKTIAQEKMRSWTLNGYVKDLQNIWVMHDIDDPWMTWTTIHNRLDFRYYPSQKLSIGISARNNLNFGELVTAFPGIAGTTEQDPGFMDLSWKVANGESYVLSSQLDRAYMEYTHKKLSARIGRQRVNWGIGLVWNPNDIFNTFSYFDFDYEERPGSDALKLEYYTSMTSSAQLVAKLDSSEELTIAAMYRLNKWNYDIQLLGGVTPKDLVFGAGWAGQIEGGGFRGEASYFIPREEGEGQLVATIEGDYTLKDGWYFHAALLYNSEGTTEDAGYGGLMPEMDVSAKTLTRSRLSTFAQVSYPLTPLINTGIAAIFNPYDESNFVGPSVDFSLSPNTSVMLFAQVFGGDPGTEYGDYGKIGYLRLRWAF